MHWVLQMGFTSLPWVLQAPAAQANPSPASWRAPIMPDAVRGKQLYEQLVAELEEMGDSDALEFVSQLCKQTPPSGEFDSTDLQWFKHVLRGREVWDALIPLVDLARLLAGEAARCNTDKFTKASMKESGYCLYACACAGQARPKAAGPRAHNARGHAELPTKKVGCPARFAVLPSPDHPGYVCVRYLCYERARLPRSDAALRHCGCALTRGDLAGEQP